MCSLLHFRAMALSTGLAQARVPFETGACFVPGTLVHTSTGLVPIEQIKVGDLVLSRAENGEGPLQFKPVLNTFVHHDKPVLRVAYKLPSEPDREFVLTSTQDHPFWADGVGWTAAALLKGDYAGPDRLHLHDASLVDVAGTTVVYRTDQPGVGWIGPADRESTGALWDYNARKLVKGSGVPYQWDVWDQADGDDLSLRTTVYNIEVADFHTYFVGRHGVWVHNAECSGSDLPPTHPPQGCISR